MLKTDPKMSMNKAKELAKQSHLCYGMVGTYTKKGFHIQWYVGSYEEMMYVPGMKAIFNEDEEFLI
jgi:hypothetical protein